MAPSKQRSLFLKDHSGALLVSLIEYCVGPGLSDLHAVEIRDPKLKAGVPTRALGLYDPGPGYQVSLSVYESFRFAEGNL